MQIISINEYDKKVRTLSPYTMTSVITTSDFNGDLRLQLGSGEAAQMTLYIVQLQKELMLKLLGNNLYAELDATPTPAKWTELITAGTTYYTYNGYKYKYPGLARMIACYCYVKWNDIETTSPTPQGETRSTSTNGDAAYNFGKQVRIWNECQRLYYEVVNYINYKNYETTDYFADFIYEEFEMANSFGI